MSTTLFVIIGVASIAAFVIASLSQSPQQPHVVYIHTVEPERRGIGCLPLIVGGIIILVGLRLFSGT